MNSALKTTEDNKLSTQLAERNISSAQWHTLSKNLYPGAAPASVLLVIDYCRARQLDPMKKPCHIVPMYVEDKVTGKKGMRDVVLPGIYELRTTAQRTGQYLGHSKPVYGPEVDFKGVLAPAWCEMAMYRWNQQSGQRIEFPVRVVFAEAVGIVKATGKPNDRWAKAPTQMLTKCTEAAGLREAFPDEFGGEMAAEEIEGQDLAPRTIKKSATLSDITGGHDEQPEPTADDGPVTIDAEPVDQATNEIPAPADKNAGHTDLPAGSPATFTADEVKKLIERAKTEGQVNDAMDLIREVEASDDRKALKRLAIDKYNDIVG